MSSPEQIEMDGRCDWNQSLDKLPVNCDVLVIGCGPAGSACAKVLAQAGLHVVQADARTFPRDKTCGDGLVPDTHAALRRLGVLDEVLSAAHVVQAARCVAPSGRYIDVPGELAVIPRRKLDAILCRAAVQAGSTMVAPARFVAPLISASGRITGATLVADENARDIQARWIILATGAAADNLELLGMCQRRGASSMAMRAYVRHPGLAQVVPGMRFTWHSELKGGYGWVFPGPDHIFNIGIGTFPAAAPAVNGRAGPTERKNLRAMFADFQRVDPVAKRLVEEGEVVGQPAGAPLRCDLEGAQWSRDGLLLAGDAAGATYAFSGEGIGKSLETGIACAEVLLEHVQWNGQTSDVEDTAVRKSHSARLTALLPQFRMYRKAASFNQHPWLLNLVIWRAQNSPRIIRALADILAERRQPDSLFSWRGLRGLLLRG
ncbi:NAD(P)/FAD-dependent oxidoreductase [Rhodoferax sp.]|jgi:geranylgeranyl reductase family protein|uniref:NAD(P)/FAD-dependent oxidoreductase n=1 Tax=Rhodoferax sp. TaxID=50421 RepID=UPI0025E7A6FA|nr:NAD(P)/FAD-dependent oxidoreductase [Rhodoferax sp.]